MVKQLFQVFFILYSVILFSQEKSAIDSLENSIISLPKNFQLQKIKSISHNQITNNISQSEEILKKGEEIAIELNDSLSLAEIYKKLAIVYSYSENLEKKFWSTSTLWSLMVIGKLSSMAFGKVSSTAIGKVLSTSLGRYRRRCLGAGSSKSIGQLFSWNSFKKIFQKFILEKPLWEFFLLIFIYCFWGELI